MKYSKSKYNNSKKKFSRKNHNKPRLTHKRKTQRARGRRTAKKSIFKKNLSRKPRPYTLPKPKSKPKPFPKPIPLPKPKLSKSTLDDLSSLFSSALDIRNAPDIDPIDFAPPGTEHSPHSPVLTVKQLQKMILDEKTSKLDAAREKARKDMQQYMDIIHQISPPK
jgi:hypothetical protein